MNFLNSNSHTARNIADTCNLDVRTVNKHVYSVLTDLGFTLSETKDSNIETYGEFEIQRLWSPAGRLNHLIMNQPMAEMLATRFDTKTAYQIQKLVRQYKELGGFLIQTLFNTYGNEAVFNALVTIGLMEKLPEGKVFTLLMENLKNKGGRTQAIFVQMPITELVSDDPETYATRMVKSLYIYGETGYQLINALTRQDLAQGIELDLNA